MVQINFEWDENKNQENIKKHKVSFDEAKTAFSDDCARIISARPANKYEKKQYMGFYYER